LDGMGTAQYEAVRLATPSRCRATRHGSLSNEKAAIEMAELKQICDRLALATDLPPSEIPCFVRAFRRSGIE
jgi:hypothetical protein